MFKYEDFNLLILKNLISFRLKSVFILPIRFKIVQRYKN
jgi:hypothetical protein